MCQSVRLCIVLVCIFISCTIGILICQVQFRNILLEKVTGYVTTAAALLKSQNFLKIKGDELGDTTAHELSTWEIILSQFVCSTMISIWQYS